MYRLYLNCGSKRAIILNLTTQLASGIRSTEYPHDLLDEERFYKGKEPWEEWIDEQFSDYITYTAENLSDFPELLL